MARRSTMTLDNIKAAKSAPTLAKAPDADERRRGQTLRLSVPAWKALKMIAAEEERTCHELLLESVNMLFGTRGKPPIA